MAFSETKKIDKDEGQTWVMENVVSGMAWDSTLWVDKFGIWEEVAYTGPNNGKVLKMFYFKSIDTTLMINVVKKTVIVWRFGLQHQ